MPSDPQNPFGDESLDPHAARSEESLSGAPNPAPHREPPLPEVPEFNGPEAAPVPARPAHYQPSHSQPSQQQRGNDTIPGPIIFKRRRFSFGNLLTALVIIGISVPAVYLLLQMRQQMAEESRELQFKPAKARLSMPTNKNWQDFAFILRPGDQVVITAAGEYFNSVGGVITADGVPGSENENNHRAHDPLFPHGCLIARTKGNPTEVFHIGKAGVLKTDSGGRLQVKVNDLELRGNRGELVLEARTFYKDAPGGETLRGVRDSAKTPISL